MGLTPNEKKIYNFLKEGGPYSIDELVEKLNSEKTESAVPATEKSVVKSIDKLKTKTKNVQELGYNWKDGKKFWIPSDSSQADHSSTHTGLFTGSTPSLTHNESKLIDTLAKEGTYTLSDLSKKLDTTQSNLKVRVQKLVNKGARIKVEGRGKATLYSVPQPTLQDIIAHSTYEPVKTSLLQPYKIKTKKANHPKVAFANTLNIGGADNTDMVQNFLRYCKADECDGLVLTGNVIKMNLKKSSIFIDEIAKIASTEMDPSKVRYPNSIRNPAKMAKEGKPNFMTLREKLDMIVDNRLEQVFTDKKGKPLYNGPVYVFFGDQEEELVRRLTHDCLKQVMLQEREDVDNTMKSLSARIKENTTQIKEMEKEILAEAEFNPKTEGAEYTREFILETLEEYGELEDYNQKKDSIEHMKSDIAQYKIYKKRLKQEHLNNDEEYVRKVTNAMRGLVVGMYESAIPNSKVISTGEGYLKVGDKVIKIIHDARRNSKSPSDTIMNYVLNEAKNETSAGEDFPDAIVCGGLSTTHTMLPYPNIDETGNNTVNLFTLPTCLNREKLEEIVQSEVRTKDLQTKLATKLDFVTGAVILEYVDGISKEKVLLESYLTNNSKFRNDLKIKDHNLMYIFNQSDLHIGSKYCTLLEDGDDIRYMYEVIQEWLVSNEIPIVQVNDLGDMIQAKNYDTENERHSEFLTPHEVDIEIKRISQIAKSPAKREKLIKKLLKKNTVRAGIIPPQQQKFEFMDLINYTLLDQVIERHRKLKMYGAAVNLTGGNHSEHTFDGETIPVLDIRREVLLKTAAKESEVVSSVMGKNTANEGLVGIVENPDMSFEEALEEGSCLYAEYHRHSQGSSKTKDSMKASRDAYTKRGRTFTATKGRTTINYKGHDHKGGFSFSKNAIHVGVPCAQDRNEFGEQRDFPLATQGFQMLGLPVDGVDSGPVVSTFIYKENLENWIKKKKKKIDMKGLCDNSVIYD